MSWQHIRGHDAVTRIFNHAWKRGRLGHAYLFSGPRGVGKRTFARELAKALLCESERSDLVACDQCPSCHQIDAGTHPDLSMATRPEDTLDLPIEVVRELCGHLALKPARGFRKVAILDDADDLNEASANCFLKTLEEPPPGCMLILIGTGPERQMSTIVSRCQLVRFAPLSAENLRIVLKSQGIEDDTRLTRVMRLAGGSVGQALALDDDALWTFRQRILNDLSSRDIDPVDLSEQWMGFIEDAGKDAASQRGRASVVLRILIELLQSSLHLCVGDSGESIESHERRLIDDLARRLGTDRILEWLDRTFEADMHVDRRVQLVLAIEALADALARPLPTIKESA